MRQVHIVGLYCPYGAGVAEHLDHDAHRAAGQSPREGGGGAPVETYSVRPLWQN